MKPAIRVYGTDWCRLTFGVREYLMRARVAYEYFDIERDARADKFVRGMSGGQRRYPVVVIARRAVINPMPAELHAILEREKVG